MLIASGAGMIRVLTRSAGLASFLAVGLVVASAGAAPHDAEQADRLRIQAHLSKVEQRLRAAPVATLATAARHSRARVLDELHRYWQAGIFPRNSQHIGLIEDGKLVPAIDRSYPLEQAADAIRYLAAGHARGKVVVTVSRPHE